MSYFTVFLCWSVYTSGSAKLPYDIRVWISNLIQRDPWNAIHYRCHNLSSAWISLGRTVHDLTTLHLTESGKTKLLRHCLRNYAQRLRFVKFCWCLVTKVAFLTLDQTAPHVIWIERCMIDGHQGSRTGCFWTSHMTGIGWRLRWWYYSCSIIEHIHVHRVIIIYFRTWS